MLIPFAAFRLFSTKEKTPWHSTYYSDPYKLVRKRYIHEAMFTAICVLGVAIITGSVYSFSIYLLQLIKVIISPRLYLIEYFLN